MATCYLGPAFLGCVPCFVRCACAVCGCNIVFTVILAVMKEVMKGRLGDKQGYEICCSVEEEKIVGRAGGRLYGKDIELCINDTGVTGKVGTEEVDVVLDGGVLRGKIGLQDITLRGVDQVSGFFGQPIVGWHVVAQQEGNELVGQLASVTLNHTFRLELGGAPGWVGTLAVVVAFYALDPRAQVTVSA